MGEIERQVIDRLTAHDLRFTIARRQIVKALRDAGGPVTLPELLDLAPDLAQSSAYRNLALLEEAGVVHRLVHGTDHARYELAESLTEHHHHLVCDNCGAVSDVTFGEETESMLDRSIAAAADRERFHVNRHVLDLHGICWACSKSR